MKSQDLKFDLFKGLDVSLIASLLVLGTTATAHARHDGAGNHPILGNREANRAERLESRAQRRDLILQNRVLQGNFPSTVPTAATVDLGARRTRGQHQFRGNTAVLFPGQVSTFHTSRPNQGRSTYINDLGRSRAVTRGLSLDLSSTSKNIVVGQNLFDGNTTIQVGGQTRVLSAGSRVTAAEYAALSEKLTTGTQTLTLSSRGAAEGGSLNLNLVSDDGATIRASELVIPQNVSVTGDFARTADGVRVTRDVVNYGSLLATSSNANRNTAVISARDINNEKGASISSVSSASNPALNLALRADRELNNQGTITSAGDLELSAGRSVNNSSAAHANGSVIISAPEINNGSSITAANGDITLNAGADSGLYVNNYGGTLNAAEGAINIRSADYSGTADTSLFGGNLYSAVVNINAGQGTADLTANEVTGVVNTKGLAAHVSTNTSDLLLGEQCLTGDPTYYNTGNIVLGGNIVVAEKLAIIAGGNITTNKTSLLVQARDGANQGCDINIIAGANVVAGSGETPGTLGTQPPISGNTTSSVTFNTNSATGGNIDLSTVTGFSKIDASGAANQKAGNITMAAFADGTGTRGKILLNEQWELNANGSGASANGSISVIAGSKSASAIIVDEVQNFNGTGGAANISVINAQPTTSNGAAITFNTVGSITTGNTIVASSTTATGGTVSTGLLLSAGSVTITSGGDAVLGEVQAGTGALVKIQSLGKLDINDISTLANPNFTLKSQITATGDILMRGEIRTDGGILMVSGGDITTGTGGVNNPALTVNPDGDAGNIAVIAGANFQVNPTNVTVTGASVTGGDILFNAGNKIQDFRASSNLNGSGGTINLIAFEGIIDLPVSPTPFSVRADSNGGTFNNGNINIIAGANVSNAIVMGGAQTDGSNNNTGNINILAQDPNTGPVVLSTTAGFAGVSAGTFLGGTSNPNSGINITRQVATNGGKLLFNAGSGGVQFADIARFGHFEVTSLGNITNHGPFDCTIYGAGDQANTLLWTATGNISFAGRINLHSSGGTPPPVDGGGGVVMVAGGTVQSIINDLGGFSDSAIETNSGQDGGNITVVAGASFTRAGDSLTITGSSVGGGSILFDGTAVGGFTGEVITHIDSHSQGGIDQNHLDGGNINLISFNDIKLDPGTATFFSPGGSSFNVPPPVFGTNGDVTIVAKGVLTVGKITMSDNQGGSVTIRAATPSSATIDITPNTLSAFGNVTSGSFTTGALSNTVFNFPTLFNSGNGGVGLSIATLADVTLGNIDVRGTTLGIGGGDVSIQGGKIVVGTINTSSTTANGSAGDITIVSNSATTFNLGGGGTNGSGVLTADAGTVGDGADISITNTGSGGINVTAIPSTTVTDGDGAGISLDAGTANLNVTAFGASITRNGAGADGDGGTIGLHYGTLTGSAGMTLTANGTGTGDGGAIDVFAGNAAAFGVLNANGGNTGVGGAGGIVSLSVVNAASFNPNAISANGAGTAGGGGTIFVENRGAGGITLDTADYSFTAFGAGGHFTADANTGPLVASAALTLSANAGGAGFSNGTITLDGLSLSSPGNTNLTATGGLAGTGDITLASPNGVSTNGGSFTANSGGTFNAVNIKTAGAANSGPISLTAGGKIGISPVLSPTLNTSATGGNKNGGAVTVASSTGDISLGNVFTDGSGTGNAGNISVTSSAGKIDFANISATGPAAATVALTSTNGDITSVGNVVSPTAAFTVNLLGASPGDATFSLDSTVSSITGTGGGTITFPAGSTPIVINGLGGNQSFVGTTTNSATGVSITGAINTTGTLTFTTPRFATTNNINAASLTVQSTGNLDVVGAGGSPTITATTPPAGTPGNPSTPTAIIFATGIGSNLNLSSNLTFNGDVSLNNSGGTTTSNAGSLFTGNNNIKLTTDLWNKLGGGNIIANNLIFVGATIANTTGALDLSANGPINFQGRDLAIIALTDINLGGILIDTSNSLGNAGNVTILAGYKFDPAVTTPLTGSTQPFTFSASQTSSGSILGTSTIDANAKGATGNGGTITAIANGGSVSIGNFNTSSVGGAGGDALLVGSTGVNIGNTNSVGATSSGDFTASVSTPTVVNGPSIVVQGGALSGGSFQPGAVKNVGNLFASALNASNADILLETKGLMNLLGALNGKSITLDGDGQSDIFFGVAVNSITANQVAGGHGGSIVIDTKTIGVSGGIPLTLNATGTGTGGGGFIDVKTTTDLTTGPGGTVIANAGAPGSGGTIHLETTGNLTTLAGGINATGGAAGAGAGADISLKAGTDGTGTLTLTDVNYLTQANAQGANGNGGKLVLDSQLMVFGSTAIAPLTLSANGQGTGSGGSVTFRNDDPTQTFISNPAKAPKPPANFLAITADSGTGSGGAGGTIIVDVGGNLTVDTTKVSAAAKGANGNGGNYTFIADNVSGKTGNLIITGNLDASGKGAGADGTVTLSSDSKKAFTIGGTKTPKNGIFGIISAAVSTVGNALGGVTVLTTGALDSAAVTLSAGARGAIAVGKDQEIKATASLTLSTVDGKLGKKALAVNAPILDLSTSGLGSANVASNFNGAVTLTDGQVGGDLILTTLKGLNVSSYTANDGSINLKAGDGVLSVTGNVLATNGAITLSNSNLATGSLLIAAGATVVTGGKGGNVILAIGTPPKKGSGPNALAGFTVTPTGKGLAFFGPNAATGVLSGGTVNVNATNKNVIFNNLSAGGQTISVGNGATITADPPSRTPVQTVAFNNFANSIEIDGATSSTFPAFTSQTPTVDFDSSHLGLVNSNRIDSAAVTSGIMLFSTISASSLNTDTNSSGSEGSNSALISSGSKGLLNIATVGATDYATINFGDTNLDTAGGTNDLIVNAAFHSDREAGQQAFLLDKQPGVKLSTVESQSIGTRHVLSKGNVVFAPFSDMVVETPHGTVRLAAGSIALVMQSDSGMAVYDLHDQSKNAVVVSTKNKQMSLSPGRQVLISSHSANDFEAVNPIELVQYRALNQSKLDNGWNVYTSEFSIPSACYAVKPLKQLMTSNHHEAKGLTKRLLKTAAVLMVLSPDQGDFVQFFKRQMTAMN